MNEALVEACLRVARLTHDLAEARAEVAELKSGMAAGSADKLGVQVKTAPGRALSKLADPGALPTKGPSTDE